MSSRPTLYHTHAGRFSEQIRGPRRGPLTPKRPCRESYRSRRVRDISRWLWFGGLKKKPRTPMARTQAIFKYLEEEKKQADREKTKEAIPTPGKVGLLGRVFGKIFKGKKSGKEK